MSDVKPRECTIDGGRVNPCEALSDATELGGNGIRYQGVKSQYLINTETGRFSRNLFALKSGKFSKQGVYLNFCPFCGKPIISEETGEALPPSVSDNREKVAGT